MPEDPSYKMAVMSAEAWYFLDRLQHDKLTPEAQEEDRRRKWRKLTAIMQVAMRYPIYYSRYAPEVIVLSWFFGFPSFGRVQDVEKLRRIPVDAGPWLERWTQMDLFRPAAPPAPEVAKKGYEGDAEFQALCAEIEEVVLKTLTGRV